MKTSMNLLLWNTHITQEHFPLLGKLKATGFDGVEIPLFEGDANHYKTLAAELKKQAWPARVSLASARRRIRSTPIRASARPHSNGTSGPSR